MSDIDLGEIIRVEAVPRKPGQGLRQTRRFKLVPSGERLLIPRSRFGHVHVRGMTGSGKTSLSLCLLTVQLLEPKRSGERDPLFVFDMGGDQNLFWTTLEAARTQGRTFRYLTLDDSAAYCFPPFQAIPSGDQNLIRITQMLIAAFHMHHGLIYGGNYYSQQNLSALLRVSRKLVQSGGNPTLEDVARYLDDPLNRREFKDSDQVRATFDFLLEYPQLRSGPSRDQEILLERAVDEAEVIYFFCPTLEEPLTAPLIAGLGLFSLLAVCIRRKRQGKPRRQVRILIDEWQELLGHSISRFLVQCRKFDIPTLVLANQSTRQLESRDLSLADQVFEGCFLRQYFTSLGDDLRVLQSLSDTIIETTGGMTHGGLLDTSFQERENEEPGLHENVIREVTARFGYSFVCLNDGTGHRDPIIVRQTHQGRPDYSERPMPTKPPAPTATAPPSPAPKPRAATRGPRRQARQQAIAQLIAACLAAEQWQG